MYSGDVSEEQVSLIVVIRPFMDALLSQVLQNDLLPTELVAVVSGAVPSSSVAVGVDEVFTTVHALPVYEMRGHEDLITKLLVDFLKVLNEVEDQIVVAGVPNVVFHAVVWPLHFEFNNNGNLISYSLGACFHEVNELLTIFVRDKHRWNSETSSAAIV